MKRILPAAALLALLLPASAGAHARLVRTDPADGSVLGKAPTAVRILFDDVIQPAGAEAIRNGGASVLAGPPTRAGTRTMLVPLRPLGDGDYTVRWRAVSDDGHLLQGVLAFAVGEGRAPPVAALTVDTTVAPTTILTRWLFLAGLLLAAGVAVFELAVSRADPKVTASIGAVGFALATVGSFALVPHEGNDPTRAERVYEAGALIAMTGLAAAAIALVESRSRIVAWAAAIALLPVPTLAGHALDRGQPRAVTVVADVLHLAGAAVWVGGVVALAAFLVRGVDRLATAQRFSRVALVSVIAIAVTGVARAWTELGSVGQLLDTGYGRAITFKTVLFAALVALGVLNRQRLIPRRAFASLQRSVGAETVLLAGVVVGAAFLTALPPGRALAKQSAEPPAGPPPAPPPGAIVAAKPVGTNVVAVAVSGREVQVTALGQDNNGVELGPVLVNGIPADTRCGSGCFAVTLAAPPRKLAVATKSAVLATFSVPARAPSGEALANRAFVAFQRARSVTTDEELSSRPGFTLRTRFVSEAPNRYSYAIQGGPRAIVVGSRRWDRQPGSKTWTLTDTSPSAQPTPAWRAAADARLIGPNRVAFYDPTIPGWFDVTVDEETGLPLELRMAAAAHFMHHTYRDYDAPRKIFPPQPG